jgi:hypothetical protein
MMHDACCEKMKVKVTAKGSQVGKGGLPPPKSFNLVEELFKERGQASLPDL